MNADLEAQLREMGGEYRAVVERLVGGLEGLEGLESSINLPNPPTFAKPLPNLCQTSPTLNPQPPTLNHQFSNFFSRYLVAASLLVVLGLGAFLLFNFSPSAAFGRSVSAASSQQPADSVGGGRLPLSLAVEHGLLNTETLRAKRALPSFSNSPISPSPSPYALASLHTDAAVREIIRTQNADGSWTNDFLTRQNAAALKLCESAEARIAYKKAMRNLRVRGLL